ncbi:MAG: hypothetical protein QM765_07420 [Myxococcales bacterium]
MSADSVMPIEVLREIRDAVNRASDKLSERIDNLEKKLGDRIDNVETGLCARIDETNRRLESLERRTTQGFIETNTKLADLTGRVDGLNERVDQMSGEIRELRTGMTRMGDRIEIILTGQMGQDLRDLKSGCWWSKGR